LIDDFLYNDKDMTNNQGPKIALLDTGNSSIQLPEFVWRNILKELIKQNNDDLIFIGHKFRRQYKNN
jgi:hypothetical protein